MNTRRFSIAAIALLACSTCSAQSRIQDVIYEKSAGAAFTMDVFLPAQQNRAAVVWLVSGGWFSRHEDINLPIAKLFNDNGFTVFQVVHGAQPRYKIMEIVDQVRKAVRFIKTNANHYGIDANRVGISGASAGGHLSLMVAGMADPGSEVNAVAAIFPPTDFRNYGAAGKMPFDNPMMAPFIPAFGVDVKGPKERMDDVARQTSPITYVTPKFPPTLLVHGDKDVLVPLQQSQDLAKTFEKSGVAHKLVAVPGGGHDEKTWGPAVPEMLMWFKEKLRA